jgi:hypothetical protein
MSIDIEYQAARTVWASRILGYICQKIPQDRLSHVDNDFESEEDILLDKDDLEVVSDTNQTLTATPGGEPQRIKEKFLDCLAEIMSPKHQWDGVITTSLMAVEEGVRLNIAANSGFEGDAHKWEELERAIKDCLKAQASNGNDMPR